MKLRSIRTEDQFLEAMSQIESLWHALPGTSEAELREVLVDLAWAYEERARLRISQIAPDVLADQAPTGRRPAEEMTKGKSSAHSGGSPDPDRLRGDQGGGS